MQIWVKSILCFFYEHNHCWFWKSRVNKLEIQPSIPVMDHYLTQKKNRRKESSKDIIKKMESWSMEWWGTKLWLWSWFPVVVITENQDGYSGSSAPGYLYSRCRKMIWDVSGKHAGFIFTAFFCGLKITFISSTRVCSVVTLCHFRNQVPLLAYGALMICFKLFHFKLPPSWNWTKLVMPYLYI